MTENTEIIEVTEVSIENGIIASEQNINVSTEILESMKQANESLIRTTEKLSRMEDTLIQDENVANKYMCTKKCNIIFYTLLIIGFIAIGIYAFCKFYLIPNSK